MEFWKVIEKRKSVRRFKDEPVPREKIKRVLEAARLAPSWKNSQPWEYVVVDDPDKVKALRTGLNKLINAPVFVVACGLPSKSGRHNEQDYYLVDVSISMQQLVLAATNEGLGTCWMGLVDEPKLKKLFGIPDELKVVAVTPLGFPDEGLTGKAVEKTVKAVIGGKKSLREFVHLNSWGKKLEE
jgi:nitroreductase